MTADLKTMLTTGLSLFVSLWIMLSLMQAFT